jgi:hypothetical protein
MSHGLLKARHGLNADAFTEIIRNTAQASNPTLRLGANRPSDGATVKNISRGRRNAESSVDLNRLPDNLQTNAAVNRPRRND